MSEEQLKKKKRIRGGHKAYVTSTLEKIQGLLREFDPSTLNQLKTYQIALTEKLRVLGDLDEEILGLINRPRNRGHWNLQRIYPRNDRENR